MDKNLFDNLITGSFYERLFSYMEAVGLKEIKIIYSGGGDSGGMDAMEFQPEMKSDVANGIRENLEDDLCGPIYSRHGSFADGGGFYVNGEVSYRADNKQVWISGTDHTTTYEGEYNEETGEYENEEESEDEWEELIYDHKEDRANTKEEDCLFAYMYAKDFLKGKLPEELHNKMLTLASTNNDEYAVKYIKNLK